MKIVLKYIFIFFLILQISNSLADLPNHFTLAPWREKGDFADLLSGKQIVGSDKLFQVVDFSTQRIIGHKKRDQVHVDGDWHRGVQAYVYHVDANGKMKVLVQKRSNRVDIAKGKYDQSLATQVLPSDNNDQLATLKRGLLDEIGLDMGKVKNVFPIGKSGWLRVSKKYDENLSVYNREFISLYGVEVNSEDDVQPKNPKIESVEWMDWESYVDLLTSKPNQFTKTGRFYVINPILREYTKKALLNLADEEAKQEFPLKSTCYYSYPTGYDLVVNSWADTGRVDISLFEATPMGLKEVRTWENVQRFDVSDVKDQQSAQVRFFDAKGTCWRVSNNEIRQEEVPVVAAEDIAAVEKISTNLKEVFRGLKAKATEPQILLELETLERKFDFNLGKILTRVRLGEIKLFADFRSTATDKALTSKSVANPIIVALPGTFDPAHLSHIDSLLDSIVKISEVLKGRPIIGVIAPLGDFAPGPDGKTSWKENKTKVIDRYELSTELTKLFAPLIATSKVGIDYPSNTGTQNIMQLALLNQHPVLGCDKMDIYIAAGAETYKRWYSGSLDWLEALLSPNLKGKPTLGVVVRREGGVPLEDKVISQNEKRVILVDKYDVLNLHSSDLRKDKDIFQMQPANVTKLAFEKGLYNLTENDILKSSTKQLSLKDYRLIALIRQAA